MTTNKQFVITTPSGARDITVAVKYETPLFVVHEPVDVQLRKGTRAKNVVTHKASGGTLSRHLYLMRQAKAFVNRLEAMELAEGECFNVERLDEREARRRLAEAHQTALDA
jgi:hypothetical protein